ncbi:hypothetical protein [Flavilitoribacter nigricans]|uniref:Dockerin domain-containing protein n=1 Tax=Flavilitoribacter nigricans (strain ATCC 23147 / DSM 23189 / NBRC 102662 / NCIMB 1420 / SS-2) TaxID=1122177 RepID=A0A2D0NBH1_FLAN2|nr:hypothetical protein [Flavilitoribacter nigricans]PHN05851.1 hypothetical protein CRP01_15385 [Flavilitoribacter nigricans DSM 23189 = NBRC 102662]
MCLIPFGSTAAKNRSQKLISSFLLSATVLSTFTSFKTVEVPATGAFEPSCRGAVNITLNPNLCYAHIKPTNLLLGDFNPEEYTVELFAPSGLSLGDTIPGIYAGQTIDAEVRHNLSNFSCSSQISVYDLSPPVLQLPDDAVLACTEQPDPSLTGTATASDCTPVTVNYTDEWTETLCGNPKVEILRIWTATDEQGFTAVDTQHIDIVRATAQDMRFPTDMEFTCTEYRNDPLIIEASKDRAGIPSLVDNPRCGLIYTHQDRRIALCGDPENSFVILREWTVLDACGNQVFTVDGAGNGNVQLIRVIDQTAPVIEPIIQDLPATLRPEDNGLAKCSAVGFIPAPNVFDECNEVTIRIFSAVGELEYVNGVDGSEGGYIPFPGLTLGGPHQIYYEVEDACGNKSEISALVRVVDTDVPILLCDQRVTVSLSLNGVGRLEPFMIDEGTRDNCCLDKMEIKWVDEPIISFRERIDIYCQTEPRQAILRAWDCNGNFNDCTTTVVTHDPLPAQIVSVPPEVIEVDCGTDRNIFASAQYQAPVFQDNCPQNIQYLVRDSTNACGTSDLYREWALQDHPDHAVLRVSQLVRFIDEEAPTISFDPASPACDTDGDCLGEVSYPIIVADNCSDVLNISHRFSQDGGAFVNDTFGQIVLGPDGFTLEGDYPIGEHEIYVTVTDPCGNTTNGRYPLVVVGCTPPELLCGEELEFYIGEDQQLVLSPEDFIASVSDACDDFSLTFADTGLSERIFDCDSLGVREVSIWATDVNNNRSKCTVSFVIASEGIGCQPLGRLEGRIVNQADQGIALVQVSLNGPDTLRTVTGTDGRYLFEGVPLDTDYELEVRKNINPGNGVSVLDIIRMSRHILGLNYLTDPYLVIAADVNNSGNVSTLDIIAARRVILGLSDQFADNPDSWRFIPADFEFEDPERPLQERIPRSINFKLLFEETNIDFLGIKFGDVNYSADPLK